MATILAVLRLFSIANPLLAAQLGKKLYEN
jgi:hypothetical protein